MTIATEEKETPDSCETLTHTDGQRLYYREWRPPQEISVRGAVLLSHGYGEHLARYGGIGRRLAAEGFVVGGCDLRGFGLSGGTRAFVKDYVDYVEDLRLSEMRLRQSIPASTPVFIYAHSMGGLVALLYAGRFPEVPIDGLALSGPLLGTVRNVPAWQLAFGRQLNRLFPKTRMTAPIDPRVLTHDPERQAMLAADTLFPRKLTLSWVFATEKAFQEVQPCAERIAWPTLWLIPGEDRIVSIAASRAFFARLPNPERHTWRDYPGLFHELHNESLEDRNRVCTDLLQWLNARL